MTDSVPDAHLGLCVVYVMMSQEPTEVCSDARLHDEDEGDEGDEGMDAGVSRVAVDCLCRDSPDVQTTHFISCTSIWFNGHAVASDGDSDLVTDLCRLRSSVCGAELLEQTSKAADG